MDIDWNSVGNAIGITILIIVGGIALIIFIFWAQYTTEKENDAEKRAKEKEEWEKEKSEEKAIFDKLVKDNNLSKAQESVFKRISLILKGGIASNDKNGANFLSDFERNIKNFDSGNLDHPLIKESIKIVYEKLFERGNKENCHYSLEIAAKFAKKYNL